MLKFEKMKMNAIILDNGYCIVYWWRLNLLILAPGPGTTPRSAAATAAAMTASVKGLRVATILATAAFTTTGIFATSAAD
jgi:hypothetical protein